MIKYCYDKWNKNCGKLEQVIRENLTTLEDCEYKYLVELVVENILNGDIDEDSWEGKWNSEKITMIDNGDYQGTLLFLIPEDTYQPSEAEYLMTYVNYGSCSGCDTLQHIQSEMSYTWFSGDPVEQTIKDFMTLCRDLVCHMIKPYNIGWRESEDFETVEVEG